ncbi:TonB-dependent receptor domain-containing protein [Membranihabitans marinus]|uniref:TonB-dependent receptor domain-containing protein n=1 Tax=Membranihabitans marinus TaxID=1227546 RepID=UPI001F37D864|nr:TonB-dependent receptor [Membranihabitans marinus]
MLYKRVQIVILFLFTSFSIIAQSTFTVSGRLTDDSDEALPFANIILHKSVDSTMATMDYSAEDGSFILNVSEPDSYYLHISYVGYQDFTSTSFSLNDKEASKDFSTISLNVSGAMLDELVVTAKRPLLEVKPDKMVLNVAGSINASGNNALELLRKSPGVMVDQNDNISLLGRSGIRIYINGKKSPLNGDQLGQYLKSIPSEEIQKIELISQPSAKYDAEGNAGIINIVLKKNIKNGQNTNMALSYRQGEEAVYNGNIQSNWKVNQFNAFGSLSYYDSSDPNTQLIYRAQDGIVFDQTFQSLSRAKGWNYKAGLDYDINKNNVLGFMVHGGLSDNNIDKYSRAEISSSPTEIDSILISDGDSRSDNQNTSYNLNYMHTGDHETVWSIDADYGKYGNGAMQNLPNTYWNSEENYILQQNKYFIDNHSDIDIYTLKSDYERSLGDGKIGLGMKWSNVSTDNTFNYFNVINDQKIENLDRSNQFEYQEEVWATYASFNQKFHRWAVQAGLRMEHTKSTGNLISNQQSDLDKVSKKYIDFFPSFGLTYTINENHVAQLNYSRRINRPNYKSLNPFEFKLDELSYQKGNPFLTPEYSNKISLGYTLLQSITTSLSYSQTTDMISDIVQLTEENAAFQTYKNLSSQYDLSWNISAGIPITEWWTSYTNLLLYHRESKGEIITGQENSLTSNTMQIYSQHNFQLPKEWSLEIDGYYQSPSAWGGQFILHETWGINAGVQKKIFNDQANIKLGITDIFNSMNWKTHSDVGTFDVRSSGHWDSQQIKLSFSYMFGNNKIKNRKRDGGSSKEAGRI